MESVLVVESSRLARQLVKQKLATDGYEVMEAENGNQAISIASSLELDLIITDVDIPQMSGIELTRELRSRTTYEHTPILLLSATDDRVQKQQALDAGVSGWLLKPFEARRFYETIDRLPPGQQHRDE